MITASLIFGFVALAVVAAATFQEFSPKGSIVMKAEGDGHSDPGSGDSGWGNGGDDDLPF